MSKRATFLIVGFVAAFIATAGLLNIHIRLERKKLQQRAREFLVKPIPKLLTPDAEGNVGDFHAEPENGPQNGVFGYSRVLIARYAINGRIRWSARIQGEFAGISDGINSNFRSDAIETNREIQAYLAERNAILGKEWAMGYWQFIEDAMEFNDPPPEIQEEDVSHKFVPLCEGTWTNALSGILTIQPDCTFSLSQSNRQTTNMYVGDWIVGVGNPSLMFIFTRATGNNPRWSAGEKADLRVLLVDGHSLVYKMDDQTNQMQR